MAICLGVVAVRADPRFARAVSLPLVSVVTSHQSIGAGYPGMKFTQAIWVQALDGAGVPLPGAQVHWAADDAGGWVFPSDGVTGADGKLTSAWIPGSPGAGKLTATVSQGGVSKTTTVTTTSVNPPTLPLSALGVTMLNSGDATGYAIDVVPHTDPRGTYFATMLWLGGYAGLQRDGSLYHDQLQFSTWDNPAAPARLVTAGSGLTCVSFGNEGAGIACTMQYVWVPERAYRFELDAVTVAAGRNMTLHVTDRTSGIRTFVGTLFQGGHETLGYIGTFVEQFHHVFPNCLEQPLRSYTFSGVMARVNGVWSRIPNGIVGRHDPVVHCANVSAVAEADGIRVMTGQRTASDPASPSPIVVPFLRPKGLAATATGSSTVALTWTSVTGATSYQIVRSSQAGVFKAVGVSNVASFSDTGLAADTTYLYKVSAVDNGGVASDPSDIDAATTMLFSDDPIVSGVTTIKASHLAQLRLSVNAFRAAAGLPPSSFSDAGAGIRALHIAELRTSLAEARSAIGLPPIAYTDATLTAGVTFLKAVHVQEIRAAVK